jgi:carboxyl-terminal processing protease
MAKWLVAILGVFVLQAHAAPSTADDWADVKVPARLLNHFINNKTCFSTPEYFASCKQALQRASDLAGVQIADADRINFDKEFRILEKKAAGKINLNQFRLEAIKAQAQYFDPHADFEPVVTDRADRASRHQFAGLGVYLEIYKRQVRVKGVMPGSPAEASGLMAGDILLGADLPTGHLNLHSAASTSATAKLKAPAGTLTPLEIERGGRTFKIDARFDSFPVPSVLTRMEGSTGYIRITSFMPDDLCEEFESALQTVIGEGAKSLIVDLRANTGGQVPNAICTASRLLGRRIVVGQKRIQPLSSTLAALFKDDEEVTSSESIHWIRGGHDAMTNMPVVVLVDNLTASASEIFAGAMQDHRRAWLVGTRTFGKAVMQDNQMVRQMNTEGVWGGRTTTLLYQPSGRSIQRTGLTPDFTEPSQYGDDLGAYVEMREADMNPRTLKVESAPWIQPRESEISQLKKCTEGSENRSLKIYDRLIDAHRADYQLAYGLSILDCEK